MGRERGSETCAAQSRIVLRRASISVPPSAMSNGQYESCRFLLSLWRKHRNVLLNGRLQPVSAFWAIHSCTRSTATGRKSAACTRRT